MSFFQTTGTTSHKNHLFSQTTGATWLTIIEEVFSFFLRQPGQHDWQQGTTLLLILFRPSAYYIYNGRNGKRKKRKTGCCHRKYWHKQNKYILYSIVFRLFRSVRIIYITKWNGKRNERIIGRLCHRKYWHKQNKYILYSIVFRLFRSVRFVSPIRDKRRLPIAVC